jgi:hypothetical protein
MDIYILSSGRPFKQPTYDSLPKALQERTKVVVPFYERDAYKNYPVLTHENIVVDLAATRQWLVEHTDGPMVMLDDDLTFATRRLDEPAKFVNATPDDVGVLFRDIEYQLERYAHVSVSGREGANRRFEDYINTGRCMRILAFDTRVLNKHGMRFDRMKFMIDFDMTLQLLREGYDNVILNYMVHNQYGSNAEGGCSQYRTPELQTQDALLLKQFHPDYVKLTQKRTKVAWGEWGERTDVIIQWKKAYGSCKQRRVLGK